MKLKWSVSENPTGRYSSFYGRSWPSANYEDGSSAVMIGCEEDYVPSKAKSGEHSELSVYLADYSVSEGGFKWRRLKKRCKTLKEAKELAVVALEQHKHFSPPR